MLLALEETNNSTKLLLSLLLYIFKLHLKHNIVMQLETSDTILFSKMDFTSNIKQFISLDNFYQETIKENMFYLSIKKLCTLYSIPCHCSFLYDRNS